MCACDKAPPATTPCVYRINEGTAVLLGGLPDALSGWVSHAVLVGRCNQTQRGRRKAGAETAACLRILQVKGVARKEDEARYSSAQEYCACAKGWLLPKLLRAPCFGICFSQPHPHALTSATSACSVSLPLRPRGSFPLRKSKRNNNTHTYHIAAAAKPDAPSQGDAAIVRHDAGGQQARPPRGVEGNRGDASGPLVRRGGLLLPAEGAVYKTAACNAGYMKAAVCFPQLFFCPAQAPRRSRCIRWVCLFYYIPRLCEGLGSCRCAIDFAKPSEIIGGGLPHRGCDLSRPPLLRSCGAAVRTFARFRPPDPLVVGGQAPCRAPRQCF